ncbi:MAG: GNAT family N-acetyltransferase [Thiolinea sp.]
MLFDNGIALERAAFSAWPALEEQNLAGWRLRYANGYTKRANSANAVEQIDLLDDQILEQIEAFFRSRQQQPIFRITDFAVASQVDEKLIRRGYQFNDLSLVMTAPVLTDYKDQCDAEVEFLSATEWLQLFQQIAGKIGRGQATHLQMLQSIRTPAAFAVIRVNKQAACCGLAVISDDYVGLFDIATAEMFRHRGLARRLCQALISWAAGQGAQTAYLQVVGHNYSAINLYEQLGFRRAYQYWYRMGKE